MDMSACAAIAGTPHRITGIRSRSGAARTPSPVSPRRTRVARRVRQPHATARLIRDMRQCLARRRACCGRSRSDRSGRGLGVTPRFLVGATRSMAPVTAAPNACPAQSRTSSEPSGRMRQGLSLLAHNGIESVFRSGIVRSDYCSFAPAVVIPPATEGPGSSPRIDRARGAILR